jgi:hypothetical protein
MTLQCQELSKQDSKLLEVVRFARPFELLTLFKSSLTFFFIGEMLLVIDLTIHFLEGIDMFST